MPSTEREPSANSTPAKAVEFRRVALGKQKKTTTDETIVNAANPVGTEGSGGDTTPTNHNQDDLMTEETDEDYYEHDFFAKNRQRPALRSSFLRPGSTFIGSQQSGRSTHEVNVEIKAVDMESAFICGYLRIEGLTEDHPTLITYFEGEMISPKYSFFTKREEWGASAKTDIAHWSRFAPWRTISNQAKDPNYVHHNFDQQEHIYMRWKECFLVPDYTVRDIHGASYAGFYYICFDQLNGSISGFYFHQKSDKFQQLELSHVPDSGRSECYEFR
ncbi:hypothetical protein TRICI_001310 [Trichomonascus ciferrii]|uniref:Glucose-induced degradation protein 4 n=1 Tax=Trichomonascus ciferrii TaxID=44093 RepID=A0A642VA48_9ASCO|nr:hypothetical protein TRICI_001310 [Trichomonascus ciferrii]